ncbi:hypothetical protein F2Q70_00026160 [Brassica cretica]|uniref:Uncharacterized protein n=1 Tax=Brassica cretica TaxID=69181 RepID=A0A8S9L7R5_BRACR|nr:hypothetical protein F2Q70_00026160 [Brassica cretica]
MNVIGVFYPDVVTVRHYTEASKRNPKDSIQKLSCVLCCVLCKTGEIPIRFKDAEKCTKIHPTFSKGYSRKIAVQFFMKEYENSMEIYH